MHADGGIAEHRLRAGRREADEFAGRILTRVLERPEAAVRFLGVRLVVGHRSLQLRIPVHQPLAAEDVAVAEPVEERHAHGPATALVEREASARPVARTAQELELAEDAL